VIFPAPPDLEPLRAAPSFQLAFHAGGSGGPIRRIPQRSPFAVPIADAVIGLSPSSPPVTVALPRASPLPSLAALQRLPCVFPPYFTGKVPSNTRFLERTSVPSPRYLVEDCFPGVCPPTPPDLFFSNTRERPGRRAGPCSCLFEVWTAGFFFSPSAPYHGLPKSVRQVFQTGPCALQPFPSTVHPVFTFPLIPRVKVYCT